MKSEWFGRNIRFVPYFFGLSLGISALINNNNNNNNNNKNNNNNNNKRRRRKGQFKNLLIFAEMPKNDGTYI